MTLRQALIDDLSFAETGLDYMSNRIERTRYRERHKLNSMVRTLDGYASLRSDLSFLLDILPPAFLDLEVTHIKEILYPEVFHENSL